MSITAERKQELIKEYATKDGDTGSPEVQVAILSERISNLTEHFQRNHVGPFGEDDMISLELLAEMSHNAAASGHNNLMKALKPVITALDDIPALAVSEQDAARLRRGQALFLKERDAPVITGPACAVSGNVPVALGEVEKGAFNPRRVFNLPGDPWAAGSNDKRTTDVDHS